MTTMNRLRIKVQQKREALAADLAQLAKTFAAEAEKALSGGPVSSRLARRAAECDTQVAQIEGMEAVLAEWEAASQS